LIIEEVSFFDVSEMQKKPYSKADYSYHSISYRED